MAGIPFLFLMVLTVQFAIAMWNYHTLAYAVNTGARYIALHGAGCSSNGNSCGVTVGTIASQIGTAAIGIQKTSYSVTLTSASGQTKTCNPLSSCLSDSTAWPPSTNSDNLAGKNVTVSARYVYPSTFVAFWPGAGSSRFGTVVLPASATQQILF